MVRVPDSVPPAPPANVPEISNVSAFAAPTLRASAHQMAASAVLSFDFKDMCLLPSLVIRADERRRVKAIRQSQRKRRRDRGSAQEWPLGRIIRLSTTMASTIF